eukprot:753324-Hanusia_phi.AAC.3
MAKLASEKGTNKAKHIAPCCCLKQWTLDTQFLRRTSIGVWQSSSSFSNNTTCMAKGISQWTKPMSGR